MNPPNRRSMRRNSSSHVYQMHGSRLFTVIPPTFDAPAVYWYLEGTVRTIWSQQLNRGLKPFSHACNRWNAHGGTGNKYTSVRAVSLTDLSHLTTSLSNCRDLSHPERVHPTLWVGLGKIMRVNQGPFAIWVCQVHVGCNGLNELSAWLWSPSMQIVKENA